MEILTWFHLCTKIINKEKKKEKRKKKKKKRKNSPSHFITRFRHWKKMLICLSVFPLLVTIFTVIKKVIIFFAHRSVRSYLIRCERSIQFTMRSWFCVLLRCVLLSTFSLSFCVFGVFPLFDNFCTDLQHCNSTVFCFHMQNYRYSLPASILSTQPSSRVGWNSSLGWTSIFFAICT